MTGLTLTSTGIEHRIALRGMRLVARLAGMSNKTLVEHTFVNQESCDIEVVYTFPLPEDAAVSHFEVLTDDRVLTGKVEDCDKAIDQYEEAITQGDGAFTLEQQRPDVFTIRVGNIKPKQVVTIRLTYIASLEMADGRIRLAFPTTIAPRYVTSSGMDPVEAMIDGDALNPPHCLWVPYGLTMSVDVALGVRMRSIVSPSHTIDVEENKDETEYRVTLSAATSETNRDVVIELEPERENEPSLQIATGPDGATYAAVTFIPEFEEEHLGAHEPSETIFLLDCSGSMMGPSIEQAKRALELCLRSLSEGDYFNILRFGSTFEAMTSEPLRYGDKTLAQALRYVAGIDANLGGTELLPPLRSILSTKPSLSGPRQVVLLTDGQVSNEPAIVDLAKCSAAQNRIFTFGIGSASSAYLVKGLARATGGMAEFIAYNERIEDKVLRSFSRMASPKVSDVRIDWEGARVELARDQLPPVFDGDALRVVARLDGKLPERVTLHCQTPKGAANWTVATPTTCAKHDLIALEWARERIGELDEFAPMGHPSRSSHRDRLVSLSKEFNLLCRWTTFIAVEHRSEEERNAGRPALREVPVMLAQGWGDIADLSPSALANVSRRRAGAPASHMLADFALSADGPQYQRILGRYKLSTVPELSEPEPSADRLFALLQEQKSNGAFADVATLPAVHSAVVSEFARRPDELLQWVRDVLRQAGHGTDEDIVTTVLVMLLLNAHFQHDEAIWRRAGDKAIRFLAKRLGAPRRTMTRLIQELRARLGKEATARIEERGGA